MDKTNPASNNLFPIFLKLTELKVLIVGGGPVGFEKLQAIVYNCPGVQIHLVAATILPAIQELATGMKNITLSERYFQEDDLKGVNLVFVAVNNYELSREISDMAHRFNLLVNVADTPLLCDFYLGSIVQKGNLKLAISTNGQSPTLAKRLKEMLQEALPDELDELLDNLHEIRKTIKGDFHEKVKKLNELTSILSPGKSPGKA